VSGGIDARFPSGTLADRLVDRLHAVALRFEVRDPAAQLLDCVRVVGVDCGLGLAVDFIGAAVHARGLGLVLDTGTHTAVNAGDVAAVMPFGVVTDEDRLSERDPVGDGAGPGECGL
jgi:hypothetical protein